MSIKCQMVMEAMEALAPRQLAEEWDNVGLLVGSPSEDIHKILVALDVTEETVELAISKEANMIIAHHPVIFKPMPHVRTDLPLGRLLKKLIKHDISVYIAHTNLDIAEGGVNDALAAALQLTECEVLSQTSSEKLVKLVVFAPQSHAEIVREAVTRAGAGHIGNYSSCSFEAAGLGKFLPEAGTKPFIGKIGQLEIVDEIRLEFVMPEKISRRVIRAMLKAHPYEEAAYDVYQLENTVKSYGLGRVGKLPAAMPLKEFAALVKTALNLSSLNVVGEANKKVRKVAVCGGSGASLVSKAVFKGADVLLTGDVRYHDGQEAEKLGIALVDGGHFATERLVVPWVEKYLKEYAEANKWRIEVMADNQSTNVFTIY